jgi:hypothetical protein
MVVKGNHRWLRGILLQMTPVARLPASLGG